MPLIKKILFPVDFSESCYGAARYVEFFAGRFEAEILMLHAVVMGEHTLAEELLPGRQAELNAFMADEFKYFATQRVCAIGDPASVIADFAGRWAPDLVMMPTHGVGTFRRLLLGSVTAKVLHDLACPVWTGVHAESAPPLEQIHCRRVLCALDLDQRSPSILEWAASLAKEYEAELGVVHATAELSEMFLAVDLREELARTVSGQAKMQIEALQKSAGTAGPVFVNAGDPAKVVSCAVKDFNADLLVMGRHGGRNDAGFLRNNAYAILRDSPCPVLSI